jgi:hypothetical protein
MVEVVMISKGFAQFARATESALAKVVCIHINDEIDEIDELLQNCFECGCTPQEAVFEIMDDLNFEH